MNYNQALHFLYEREKFGWRLGLESMLNALRDLGNPQNDLNYVHIAGTNGKGSVAVMTESVLRQAGHKTGLFTSPHLMDVRERFRINGEMISKNDFASILTDIAPVIVKYNCTFFETCTILAFQYFHKNQTEYVCLEVGLGGRLDATNVITPQVSVITSISFDHTEHLGSSLAEIAAEKFAIVKLNTPCVIGNLAPEAFTVGKKICAEKNAPLISAKQIDAEIIKELKAHLYVSLQPDQQPIRMPFAGEQQVANLKIVLAILDALKMDQEFHIIAQGLQNAQWPARFQQVSNNPIVILDVAHNPDSIKYFVKSVKNFAKNRNTTCLFAVLQDKAFKEISDMLAAAGFRLIPLQLQSSRALPAQQLYDYLVDIKADVLPPMTINDSIKYIFSQKNSDRIFCYTGSHYTVGDVLSKIKNLTN